MVRKAELKRRSISF